jgi:propanol-preferring alcohol dehydrogenase
MKALVLKESGGPLVLEEMPMPQPGPGEVLVRVRACGLGLTLVWNRNGRGGTSGKLPRIIGHEIAGDVTWAKEGAWCWLVPMTALPSFP